MSQNPVAVPDRDGTVHFLFCLEYDEGETWPVNKVLEPGVSGYSDLAVAKDRTILCFYERANPDARTNAHSDQLALARFNLAWLTGRDGP